MSRLATLLVALASLGGLAFASPVTKPALVRTAAQQARSERLSALTTRRAQAATGLSPKVSDAAIRLRAYEKVAKK